MGYPTKHKDAFCIFRSGYLFFCDHTIGIGRTACQCFFYDKDGIPATTVMAALLVNLIMYTLAVISIGVFAILAFPKIFLNFSVVCKDLYCKWDYCLKCSCDHILLIVKKTGNFEKLAVWLEAFLRKIHCVYAADRVQNKMEAALKDYANCVELIFHKKRVLWKAFL